MAQEQQDIKTRILLAAKKLFARQGFDGTSVRQICEEAGGNVALVSYHFGGKENVFRAIFDEFFPGARLGELEPFLQDPVNGIQVLVSGILSFFARDEELSTIIHQELSMQGPRSEVIQGYLMPVWEKLKELLEKGKEQGIFHFESVELALMITLGAIIFPNQYQNNCLKPLVNNRNQDLQEKIEQTILFVLGGLHYKEK